MVDLYGIARTQFPNRPASSVVTWAEQNVWLPGSARSPRFNSSITPWTREPIERLNDDDVRSVTFVKPVQSGGSVVGEVALCYWIATATGGDICYNWEDDIKAKERWKKRIERILKATDLVFSRWPQDRNKIMTGMIIFPHLNLTVQGVHASSNLDSDSVRFEVNEEIHNWDPGRLQKAYNRTSAFWNSVIYNISNAGAIGDQLEKAFSAGTKQKWQIKCPGCGTFHAMHAKTIEGERGGLYYNSKECKRSDGTYDYVKLEQTIYYEFPCCGYQVCDLPLERRGLSLSGRYSDPEPGQKLSNRSYTLEAVAVDYIPWLDLIMEKHEALRAMRYGDPEPWKRYLQERECRFWDPNDRPLVRLITVDEHLRKSKEGMPDRVLRAMVVDKQAGSAAHGETPHYWAVIRDFDHGGNSQLVWEGKLDTDEDIEELRIAYEVQPQFVFIDSGFAATKVYQLCALYGYTPVKGEDRDYYLHRLEDGSKVRRIYSPLQDVDPFEGDNQGKAGRYTVPLMLFSKQGVRDRLAWVRASSHIRWQVPGDVSDHYKRHMQAEEPREFTHPKTGEKVWLWVQVDKRNDLFWCECVMMLIAENAGLIGAGNEAVTVKEENAGN